MQDGHLNKTRFNESALKLSATQILFSCCHLKLSKLNSSFIVDLISSIDFSKISSGDKRYFTYYQLKKMGGKKKLDIDALAQEMADMYKRGV